MKMRCIRLLSLLFAGCLLLTSAGCKKEPEAAGSSAVSAAAADGTGETVGPTNAEHTAGTTAGTETAASADTERSASPATGDDRSSDDRLTETRPTAAGTKGEITVHTAKQTNVTTAAAARRATYAFDDPTLVNLYGRVYWEGNRWDSTPWFGWTCSGFEVTFTGTYLRTEVQVNSSVCQYWNVYVDGKEPYKIAVDQNGAVDLAKDLSDGIHTVKVEKATERWASTDFRRLTTSKNGSFSAPAPMPERKILVIGDSITAGFGTDKEYTLLTDPQNQHMHNGNKTYGAYLSRAFHAQNQILGCSTYGIRQNADRTPGVMQSIFLKTDYNKDKGRDYGFDWTPDVVIINLGTNDEAAGVSEAEAAAAAGDFIRLIRSKYPRAAIIWAYGVMGRKYMSAFENMVQTLNAEGLADVYFQPLDAQKADTVGLDGHPSALTHKRMAEKLIPLIERITGWNADKIG